MSISPRKWILQLGHTQVPVAQTLFVLATAQGLDYAIRPPGTSPIFGLIEAYVPLPFWGGVLLASSIFGAIAYWRRLLVVQIVAHGVLAAVYFAFAVGLLFEVVRTGNAAGWSNAVIWASIGAYNYLWTQVVALRRRVPPFTYTEL